MSEGSSQTQSKFAKFTEGLIDYDMYGHPVSLQYDGKSTYPTGMGLIFTIFTAIFVLTILGVGMVGVIQRDFQLDSVTVVLNPYVEQDDFVIEPQYFDMAFQYIYQGSHAESFAKNPERYLNVTMIKVVNSRAETSEPQLTQQDCSQHDFHELDNDIIEEMHLKNTSYQCFADIGNWTLQGTYGQDTLIYYSFELNPCGWIKDALNITDDSCASREDIQEVIEELQIKVIFFEQSFVPSNFTEHPFQVIPQIYYFNFDMGSSTVQEVLVKKANYYLEDSPISASMNSRKKEIYQTELSQLVFGTQKYPEYPMFGIWFRRSFIEDNVRRTVNNFSDLFADLGGLLGVLLPVIAFIVGPYAQTAYNNAILKKLYKYQEKPSSSFDENNDGSPSTKQQLDPDPNTNRMIHKLLYQIKHRKAPNLSYFFAYFSFLTKCKKEWKDQEFFHTQVQSRLEFETSIDRMLKKLRQAELTTEIFFNDKQRKLIPYMYKNLIISNPQTKLIDHTNNQKNIFKVQRKMQAKVTQMQWLAEQMKTPLSSEQLHSIQKEKELKESLLAIVKDVKNNRESRMIFLGLQNLEEGVEFVANQIKSQTSEQILKTIQLRKQREKKEIQDKSATKLWLDEWEKSESKNEELKDPLLP